MEEPMKRLLILIPLILAFGLALNAEQVTVGTYPNDVSLLESSPQHMVLQLTLGQFNADPVTINGQTWFEPSLKKEGITLEAGYPQLPILARSVIIPNSARMELSLIDSEFIELNMPVAPSKGNLTRDVDPASVPYTFGDIYSGNSPWPAETSYLTEPFILRDYRGITVRFHPFVYFPQTQTLRVYTMLKFALDADGTDLTNSLTIPKTAYASEFEGIYENMFLNFGEAKYPSLGEQGRILVIKNSMFDATLQPWVDWKRQNGYTVDVVDVTAAGPTATQILAYIQAQYNQNDGLMFVQIFGDAPQVPSLTSGGGGSDPSFALLAGSDSYPDIYVGRFSAQTEAEMQTQVQRSVYYERDVQEGSEWLQRAMGIASNEGGGSQGDMGESDQVHIENIRTDLLGYGYTSVDQIYQAQGATAAQITTNLNAGRGFINYTGHGSTTSWGTTGYSNTNVNALTNDFMLPFIVSVACVNGNFVSQTCFAEAWLRSVNETTNAPAGAIGMYASSINQSWNPPMRAQDEVTDLLIAEAKQTLGGLLYNGSSKMIEVYGTSGVNEYKCWHIFGDASLMVRSKNPQPITAIYNPVLFLGMGSFMVETVPNARVTLSGGGTVYGTATTDASGIVVMNLPNPPLQPMDLTLTITAFNKVTHLGTVQVLPATGPYLIVDDMVVTDGNNNIPEFGEMITVNVTLDNVGNDTAAGVSVTITTDDQYLTVVNGTETLADIPANTTGGTVAGFNIQVAPNVPDQHVATLHIVAQCGTESYEYNRSVTLNAPAFAWNGLTIQDYLGNNNGMIDPGESVTLKFPFTNTGHAQANDLTTAMVINGVMHVAEPVTTTFTAIPAGATCEIEYFVTLSSQIPAGTQVLINTMLFSGQYSSTNSYAVNVGIVAENFETNFAGLPWQFTGGNWTIDANSYNSTNAAKSATISHSQSTAMTVTLDCPTAGTISFWKKVSSEQNYDYLRFYINNTMRNQWSGTSDVWSQITYDVSPGTNTFKWEYAKDSYSSAGSDCAWIDDIVFPSTGGVSGTPVISLQYTTVDFGEVLLGETHTQDFTISNTGDAVLIGSVVVETPYSVYQGNGTPNNMINIVVPAQSFLTFTISFAPLEEMAYNIAMQVATDDPANPDLTVQLTGEGSIVANDDPIIPMVTELKGNFPNPFNPSTTIIYSVKESSPVLIEVYNLKGQLVRTLVNEAKAAGNHQIVFDGFDNNRMPLSSGVYFFKMLAGKYSQTRKMILMK
jgi:hypothetical protein